MYVSVAVKVMVCCLQLWFVLLRPFVRGCGCSGTCWGCQRGRGVASVFPPFAVRPFNELFQFSAEKSRSRKRDKYSTVFQFSAFLQSRAICSRVQFCLPLWLVPVGLR